MKKSELKQRTDNAVEQTHDALQLLWDNIILGQRKQLVKHADIKAILDRFEVDYKV